MKVKEQASVKISNKFVALENLDDNVESIGHRKVLERI
jgi:hypothetical protein